MVIVKKSSQYSYLKYVREAIQKCELILLVNLTDIQKSALKQVALEEQHKLMFKNKNKFGTSQTEDIDLMKCNGGKIKKEVIKILWSKKLMGPVKPKKTPALKPIYKKLSPATGRLLFFNNLSCKNQKDKEALEDVTLELSRWRKRNPYSNSITVMFALKEKKHFDNLPEPFVKMAYDPGNFFDQFRANLQVKDKQGGIVYIPLPPGTKWRELEITFIDYEHVRIKVKGKVIKPRAHYSQMGFKHENAAQPIKLWKNTLRAFALNNGIIIPKFDKKGNLIKTVSIDDVKRLRKKLKSCFGIPDNPIPPYDKGKYIKGEDGKKEFVKGEGYKTAFRIKDEASPQDTINKNRSD